MDKKIMILCGSPHKKGNTNTVVQWVAESARAAGSRFEIIDVAALTYKTNGCIACMGCQKSKKFECVIKDEASPILRRIPSNDVLVFATPLYFFGPTAQLKAFTDRMYSLFKFDKTTRTIKHNLIHIKFGVLSTAGSSDFGPLRTLFDVLAGFIGVKVESLLIPFVGQTANLAKSVAVKEKAFIFGRKLASS